MNKTKEQIMEDEYKKLVMNWEKAYQQSPSIFKAAHSAMDEHAKNQAIDFAEWVDDRVYNNVLIKVRSRVRPSEYEKWCYTPVGEKTKYLSAEELYALFLQSQSQ